MRNVPSFGDNTLDSREIDKHIGYLKIGLDNTPFDVDEYADRLRDIFEETPEEWWEHYDRDEVEELINWLELRDSANEYTSDWSQGIELIEDGYFETYAASLARDLGVIPEGLDERERYFDFEIYASDLRNEYTELDEVDGYTYLVRTT